MFWKILKINRKISKIILKHFVKNFERFREILWTFSSTSENVYN